jgi:hypothetical protein
MLKTHKYLSGIIHMSGQGALSSTRRRPLHSAGFVCCAPGQRASTNRCSTAQKVRGLAVANVQFLRE